MRTGPVCALALGLAVSGTAAAQHARYPHAITLPDAPPPSAPLTAQPAAAPAAKPTIDADSILSLGVLAGPIRAEQEQILVQLIEQTADSDVEEKSDYYFRLGSLYAAQQRFFRLKGDANKSKMYLLKAVKVYKALTDNDAFRNYPKLDQALFFYGYTLQSAKYMKEARSVYDKLLKNFPNSQYVPEAHLAFADYYYDQNQLADAQARYQAVLKFPKTQAYWYALYKLGWVGLGLQKYDDALAAFSELASGTSNDAKLAQLHRAATEGLVQAAAQLGPTADVLKHVDKSAAPDVLEQLADASLSAGAFPKAVASYRHLLATAPTHEHACRWQTSIVRASLSDATIDRTKETEELVRIAAAAQHSALGDAEKDECRDNATSLAIELATNTYRSWGTTADTKTLAAADHLFTADLTAFPDPTLEATYADVLWLRADNEPNAKLRTALWIRAADAYTAANTEEARFTAALAWMNALDAAPPSAPVALTKHARKVSPRKITGNDAKLVAIVEALSTDADPDMMLAVAAIYRRTQHHDEAVTMLDRFLEQHPDDPHAELAANLMLDSLLASRPHADVVEVANAIAADTDFLSNKPQLVKNLRELLR